MYNELTKAYENNNLAIAELEEVLDTLKELNREFEQMLSEMDIKEAINEV